MAVSMADAVFSAVNAANAEHWRRLRRDPAYRAAYQAEIDALIAKHGDAWDEAFPKPQAKESP